MWVTSYQLFIHCPAPGRLLNICTEGERDYQSGDLSISPRFAPELLCDSRDHFSSLDLSLLLITRREDSLWLKTKIH